MLETRFDVVPIHVKLSLGKDSWDGYVLMGRRLIISRTEMLSLAYTVAQLQAPHALGIPLQSSDHIPHGECRHVHPTYA